MRNAIFWPLIAQVLLTALVVVRLYVTRIAEMRCRRIHPQCVMEGRNRRKEKGWSRESG